MKGAHMRVYDDIKSMLCNELEEIAKKKELTTNSLEVIYKSVDVLKDLKTIESMEIEYPEHDGYSQGWYDRHPYYMYDEAPTHSYARKRDAMGRYSRDDGYSRDTKEELRHMMDKASSDREREAIRKALDSM